LVEAIDILGTPTFAVVRSGTNGAPTPDGVTLFLDEEDAVTTGYRLSSTSRPMAFVLDANLRVVDALSIQDGAPGAKAALLNAGEEVSPREMDVHAPVLMIPNVLDQETCRMLTQVWTDAGSRETGVEASDAGGRSELLDVRQKRRRDHVVEDEDLMKQLTSTVGRRVIPEVQRAFHYRASRFEGFKIACYDSESLGFFSPHRDNLSPSTAHRRFALTLNLNAGYDGGHLRFPEFGPHLYRPPAGGAVLFSCSMLHEVTPVTEGRRFTLLSFLFNRDSSPAGSQPPASP
jgi:predicted 2-oxoglutarate/Fe(II)-dependent dioxygenase YbiX